MTGMRQWTPPATWRSRVPEDLPYVVRPNSLRYAKIFGTLVALLLISPVVIWVAFLGPPWVWDWDWVDMAGTSMLSMLVNAAIMGWLWWMMASGGPRLSIGSQGVWLRGINRPIRAHFLSWEDIDLIWLDRNRYLCLRPRDPGFASGWKGLAGMEVRAAIRRRGAPFSVPLGKHSDRPDGEVLTALQHFSAGRVAIQDLTD
jgi:hypothetical protein